MANSKIYLGSTNIGRLFQGADDISIYLGENKVYPLETQLKFQATYSGGETYELDCDGNTTLTSGNTKPSGYEYSAMIEAVIGDCVETIGARAFSGCSSLSAVTIPSGITNIEVNAFYQCSGLTSVTIPNGIIGSGAFEGCSGLTSVNLGSGVTSIGGGAFWGCTSLLSITIPSGLTSIGQEAFRNCSGLTSVNLGSGVTSIGNSAFNDCDNLTSIDIPDSVTSIGSSVFGFCNRLTNVTIGSGATSIGNNAFIYCTSLASITVNAVTPPTLGSGVFDSTNNCPIYVPCESVEAYKSASGWSDYASRIACPPFEGKFKATYSDTSTYDLNCDGNTTLSSGETKPNGYVSSAMTTAVIGDCVTTIGADAFRDCSGLTSITIPSSVTSISDSGMRACTSLSSITLPYSVTSIGYAAFRYCINLSNANIPNSVTTIGAEAFRDCRSLTNINIPSGVTSINDYAFNKCSGLTSVNIPSGVTSIGERAFELCSSLTSITVNAVTPPTLGSFVFYSTNNCPIYVPYESLNAYKSASGWSSYASRIKPINDYFRFVAKGGMTRFKLSGNTIDYSLDYGKTWTSLASDTYSPSLSSGETIMFKATSLTVNNGIGKFISTGDFDVEGNIMSLVAGDDYKTEATITNVGQFRSLFDSNSNVINASGLTLPATTISQDVYRSMFYNCSNLVTAPELPATTLGESCYKYMFRDCTSLTTAPELPATSLTQSCYSNMFNGCTSLTTVSADMLPATVLTRQCYEYMFSGCTSLITSYGLTLPAPTLEYQSYRYMFAGCSSLTFIECLATDISAYQCTTNWVSGVTNNGHFVESCNMSNWTSGVNGIPNGWSVGCQP